MLIEIEPAVESELKEILSLVNNVVSEWFSKIIPEEYYREPFLSQKQFDQMATFMEFIEKKAKSLNYKTIQLETDSEAKWAISFYQKHGYSIFEKEPNPWGYHVWLEKSLE